MKYKHKLENLKLAQKWYDAQPQSYKNANKRPGSIKQSTLTAKYN